LWEKGKKYLHCEGRESGAASILNQKEERGRQKKEGERK
jgi:hypothetical protein